MYLPLFCLKHFLPQLPPSHPPPPRSRSSLLSLTLKIHPCGESYVFVYHREGARPNFKPASHLPGHGSMKGISENALGPSVGGELWKLDPATKALGTVA